ncbi:MAG TPA: SDR family oxidoreductase, partial [Gammaproteobacteria bacterium]|nr:SDR family oxidoreductase [Gammaproteobacteria bacterium]
AVFKELESQWGGLDFLVHSLAYAPKEELRGGYVESTTHEGFMTAHDISSWSLTRLAQGAHPLMKGRPDASILTMSYLGAERYIPHYNVMGVAKASLEASVRYLAASMGPDGIRVNAVSAGPIKTLASSGIGDMRLILQHNEDRAPLRRNTTIEEVGNTSAFLTSPLASGITGEVLHVDSGYHSVAM